MSTEYGVGEIAPAWAFQIAALQAELAAARGHLRWALDVIGAPTHHEDNAEGVYDACDFCMGESDRETGDMAHDDDCPWLAANLAAGDEQMEEANDV